MDTGTQITRRAEQTEGLFVVARRWDQLGARLSAIANARSLARMLDIEFRFVWPRGRDRAVNQPLELFSPEFLAAFELEPHEVDEFTVLPYRQLLALAGADRRRSLDAAGARTMIEVDEIFEVVHDPDEPTEPATDRYRDAFRSLEWSDAVRELVEFSNDWPSDGPISAVHVRAGDIVDGAWRHVVAHEKYAPTPFIHHSIERLSRDGDRPVLVLSDNTRYLAWLKDRFACVITTDQVVPGYGRLTAVQRALADILLLSRCDQIVGPPSSAFSRLAANLSGRRVLRVDSLAPELRASQILRAGIEQHRRSPDRSAFWPGLVARDTCWYIDVFADRMPLDDRLDLAGFAAELDPDFVGAQARLARAATLAGDWRRARAAAARALLLADRAERYDDPLVEATATDIAAACLAAVHGEPVSVGELSRELAGCRALKPFWFDLERTLEALGVLVSVVERLARETPRVRRRAARALAETRAHPIQMQLLRPSGLLQHRTSPTFDPLARDLDHLALLAYDAARDAGVRMDAPRLARAGGG